jgi:phosphoribosylanthranilate isomerase
VTRVKICGCRTPEDALVAGEAGADFVGMVFAESRRRVSNEEAAEIVRALGPPLRELEQPAPPALFRTDATDLRSWYEHGAAALDRLLARKRPLAVGVFAGMTLEEINEVADETGIDLIQLSGDEPWSACLLANRQVVKVVHVAPGEDAASALGRVEPGGAIATMLDAAVDGAYGGAGRRLDWQVAATIGRRMPVWLAGGLDPANVADAIAAVQPWCVDVSSGVETDGSKDHAKIRDFVARAKGQR